MQSGYMPEHKKRYWEMQEEKEKAKKEQEERE